MATKANTTMGNTSERSMAPKVRRGPRYGTAQPRASVVYRGSLDTELEKALGLSAHQVHQLRYVWPKVIASAITVMRQLGETDAIAPITAVIDGACAGMVAPDLATAFRRCEEAEGAADVQEQQFLLDPTAQNRVRLLQLSARDQLAQTERDALLRQQEVR